MRLSNDKNIIVSLSIKRSAIMDQYKEEDAEFNDKFIEVDSK